LQGVDVFGVDQRLECFKHGLGVFEAGRDGQRGEPARAAGGRDGLGDDLGEAGVLGGGTPEHGERVIKLLVAGACHRAGEQASTAAGIA
jgi:hypothetical protein